MRRLCGFVLAGLLWASPSQAAVAFVQAAFDSTQPFITDATGVATFSGACTTGNTIIVGISTLLDRTISTVTDDGGNTYSTDAGLNITGGGTAGESWIYWAPCTTAASVVTVTLAAPVTDQGIVLIAEFSGLNNSDLLEDPDEIVDLATPYNSGDLITTVNDSLLFGVIVSDSAADFTNEAGWSLPDAGADWAGGLVAYKILSATATDDWDPTSAVDENSAQVTAAFNGTGGAASTRASDGPLLGVSPG